MRQARNYQQDTWVGFPSSRAFFWVVNCAICTIFKGHSLHFYTLADFWTSDYLICLLGLQAWDHQADTWVRFPLSIAFIWGIKHPICTVSKVTFLHFYTWADLWTSDYVICLPRLQTCNHQVDTWVGFTTLRAFLWASKRPICTISRPSGFSLSFTSISCGLIYWWFNIQKHKFKIIQAYEYRIILAWLSN